MREDTKAWVDWYSTQPGYREHWPKSPDIAPNCDHLFSLFPEFRSLFDYRTSKTRLGNVAPNLRRATDLYIAAPSIGPRFRIQHGHGTYIFAREIGSDFWVNHLVTIGSHRGIPRIGNNVTIRTGAVVTGPIDIGDGCTITANAVVSQSMPPGCKAYAPKTIFKMMQLSLVGVILAALGDIDCIALLL